MSPEKLNFLGYATVICAAALELSNNIEELIMNRHKQIVTDLWRTRVRFPKSFLLSHPFSKFIYVFKNNLENILNELFLTGSAVEEYSQPESYHSFPAWECEIKRLVKFYLFSLRY